MRMPSFVCALHVGALSIATSLPIIAHAEPIKSIPQQPQSVISLDPADAQRAAVMTIDGHTPYAHAPANFHAFATVKQGDTPIPERLTLRFSGSTQITEIRSQSPKEFHLERGGSCSEGSFYRAGDSCELLVGFTPQGAGNRLGKLTIAHSASEKPHTLVLGGQATLPVVSFTPALISTVAATYPASKGLLSAAQSLAVQGDTLYIADSGNGDIRYLGAGGAITTLTLGSPYTAPSGIAVDPFGDILFDQENVNSIGYANDFGGFFTVSGTSTDACTYNTAACQLQSETVYEPGPMAADPNGNIFFGEESDGAAVTNYTTGYPTFLRLDNTFVYDNPAGPGSIAVDGSDNMYVPVVYSGACLIDVTSYYNAEMLKLVENKVAGGRTCGFSGDGGLGTNAAISALIGQLTTDIAGNLYFSDSGNQRVRRIDASTGIITTIAGNGVAGYSGDGNAATAATLSSPTGLAVDSQGQVYIISSTTSTGTAQVVRKLGVTGYLSFPSVVKGSSSAALPFTLANTGNAPLVFTNHTISGTNPGDFTIDPITTSCILTPGSTLMAGASCKVGVIFTPSNSARRAATITFADNTVTGSNVVNVAGIGLLPSPTFTITSPAAGSSVASGTTVKFDVTVTSTSGTAPTGTVTLKVDTTSLGTVALSSGTASVSTSQTATGTHTLSATYNGDANYAAAGPITRTYAVTAAAKVPATVKLSTSANPSTKCKPSTVYVSVSAGDSAMPTGKVELKKGSTVLATATLKNGAATFSTSALKVGKSTLKAKYLGDSQHPEATSTPLEQMVKSASKCITKD